MTRSPLRPDHRWADAAANAPGPFFELVEPTPEHRWSGGYGWGDAGPISIDVLHRVQGVEVCVHTNFRPQVDATFLRAQAFHMAMQEFVGDPEPVTEPCSWTLSPSKRLVTVNDIATEFDCLEWDNGAWVGTAVLDEDAGLSVSVQVHRSLEQALAIATCADIAMSRRPPTPPT